LRLLGRFNRSLVTCSALLLSLWLPLPADAQSPVAPDDYRLAAGDSIEVRVYGEDDLSMRLDIPGTGRVEYAFVGTFDLAGKTLRQVRDEFYQRLLGDYLIEPRVSVSVVRYRNFYIYGEVARPGGYAWEPGLTVRKVITLAGGLKERASGSKWFLVPEGGSQEDQRRVSEDDRVGAGDTITIEQSFF